MKKFIVFLLFSALLFAFAACGNDNADPTEAPAAETSGTSAQETSTDAGEPTAEPADVATGAPTEEPTEEPTAEPTEEPSTEPLEPAEELKADIADISFDKSGIVENSGNAYDIRRVGEPVTVYNETLGRYTLVCTGGDASDGSCYNLFGFGEFYETLLKGYTWEVYCLCDDESQEMYALSNLHAGGVAIGFDPNDEDCGDSFFALIRDGATYAMPVFADRELDKWVHLVITFDGTDAILYINGKQAEKETMYDFFFTDNEQAKYLCIGADSSAEQTSEYFWSGEIALGKIYSRALTAEEVATEYRAIAG